jgi:double zinc ribbon protein
VSERRCPTCGALVAADAEWCGQCFTPLHSAEPQAPTAALRPAGDSGGALGGAIQIEDGRPRWTCPACDTRNPIEAGVCTACGTPFGRLLEEPSAEPQLDPQSAAVWSMVFPGLGHWKLGRRGDAIARFAMFGWSFGALLVLLVSRFGKGGMGPTMPLFLLFLGASVAIYVLSAMDAYRIAGGEQPLFGSRALLWTSAGLIVLSVLIATFVTLPAARR